MPATANKLQKPSPPRATPTRPSSPNGRKPLWKGPQEDGITFSLLSKFLVCRHRFWHRVVLGRVEDMGFNHAIEFGSMWHECEEAHCGGKPWEPALKKYMNHLICEYPTADRGIRKWYELCKRQFPLYVDYWSKHQDEKGRTPLLEEVAFRVPYALPSGRTVLLRGKWDAVMLLSAPTKKEPVLYKTWMEFWPKAKFGITNQENKTKGDIDEVGLLHTLAGNLQTMLYHTALRVCADSGDMRFMDIGRAGGLIKAITDGIPITGVLYNVIRRPLADRFALKQKVKETEREFYDRVAEKIKGDPKYNFMRWRVLLTPPDIESFRTHVFDPLLEQLCDWWEWISVDPFDPWRPRTLLEGRQMPNVCHLTNHVHWQAPWGVYDSLASGFRGDYFELLTQGKEYGLRKIKTLYPELEK